MSRNPAEKPTSGPAPTPRALRDEDLAAVAGAAYETYVVITGAKQGGDAGRVPIGVGTCTK